MMMLTESLLSREWVLPASSCWNLENLVRRRTLMMGIEAVCDAAALLCTT